jgi:ubiquinone/menaquinone biosynthesis C-methylase UbiE
MDELTIKTYDRQAQRYDEETVEFWKRFPRTIIKEFVSRLPAGSRVLSAGSGPGRDALILKVEGLNVACLDASESMVEICRSRDLKAVQGDILELPFDNESFDGVWSYTSLLHLKKAQIGNALGEIRRVLREEGIFGMGMIEGGGELYMESSGVDEPRWFAYYTKEELRNLLVNNGFEVLHFEEFKPKSKNYLNFVAKKL